MVEMPRDRSTEDFSLYQTNEQIIQRARQNLAQGPWDYLVGGSESETTMRRNRLAFDKIAFRPRVLVDVSGTDVGTNFMGHKMTIPLLLAPVAGLEGFAPEGAVGSARASEEFGIIQFVSSLTFPDLETVAESTAAPKMYQLYIHGDWEWTKSMISRISMKSMKSLKSTISMKSMKFLKCWTSAAGRKP